MEEAYNIKFSEWFYYPWKVFYRTGTDGLQDDMLWYYASDSPVGWMIPFGMVIVSLILPWVLICFFREYRKITLRQNNGLFVKPRSRTEA